MSIISIVAPDSFSYDESLHVKVIVAHRINQAPFVMIYYRPSGQDSGYWRVSVARVLLVIQNTTLYDATLPDSIFDERFPTGTILLYYVLAISTSGDQIRSEERKAVVVDNRPPVVLSIAATPCTPTSVDTVDVSANVTDGELGSGVGELLLYYSVNGTRPIGVTMAESNVTGEYVGSISPAATSSTVSYYVVALDKAGNRAVTGTFSYKVEASPRELSVMVSSRTMWMVPVLLAVSVLGVAAVALVVRRLRTTEARPLSHPIASTMSLIVALAVFAWIVSSLVSSSLWMAGLVALAYCLIMPIVDPRIDILVKLGHLRNVDRNPMVLLIFSSYVLAATGIVAIGLKLLENQLYFSEFDIGSIYRPASLFVSGALFLLAIGIVLQVLWPYLAEISVKIANTVEPD